MFLKKSILKLSLIALFSISILNVYAKPSKTVKVWRGESTWVRIPKNLAPDFIKLTNGEDSKVKSTVKGFTLSLYAERLIPYLQVKGKNQRIKRKRQDHLLPWTKKEGLPAFCKLIVCKNVKAGDYKFGPLNVKVIDKVLPQPSEWKYFLDLWQHPWAVARINNVKPFSPEHYKKMEVIWKELAYFGVKALTTTILDLPWNHQCYDGYYSMVERVKMDDGTWKFDYKLFDEYVEFGRKCGIGPDIACYTMCPWGNIVHWKDQRGKKHKVKAEPGTKEFEDMWGAFIVDFASHLKKKGWFKDTYIAMDERSPKQVSLISNFIRSRVPDMKIAMAGNRKPSEFKGITIENYSQGLHHITLNFLDELDKRRQAGYKTTFYVCCSPARPNTFMNSKDNEAFWIGVYPALVGFDGFLRWAANSWPKNPYNDASFSRWYWAPGDTYLIYPDGNPSTRLVKLRAGIVAAEKIRIMKESGWDGKEIKGLLKKYNFGPAKDGKFNFNTFRKEIDELVNR